MLPVKTTKISKGVLLVIFSFFLFLPVFHPQKAYSAYFERPIRYFHNTNTSGTSVVSNIQINLSTTLVTNDGRVNQTIRSNASSGASRETGNASIVQRIDAIGNTSRMHIR